MDETSWQPPETAPKDRPILIYGKPEDIDGVRFLGNAIYAAHWDEIDSRFCLKGGTWLGPFIDPICWQDEPPAPLLALSQAIGNKESGDAS